jgi:hypothetical protein
VKTRFALFGDVTQRIMVVCYRRFGPSYRSHLRRSNSLWLLARKVQIFVLAKCVSGHVGINKHLVSQQWLWTLLLSVTMHLCYFLWNATSGVSSSSKLVICNSFFFFFVWQPNTDTLSSLHK